MLKWRKKSGWKKLTGINVKKQTANRWYRHGVTPEQLKVLLENQGSKCGICERDLTMQTLAIDHDHQTKKFRGLLCHPCNRGLGLLGDTLSAVLKAAAYLKE